MELTILGAGAPPVPQFEQGGISIAVSFDRDTVLVDCGPLTTHRLADEEIDLTTIEELFFTHHHLDHNGSFFEFAILGWALGRTQLDIYGPDGTDDLVDGLAVAYSEHIRSWQEWGHPPEEGQGVADVETHRITASFERETESWSVAAHPVRHNLETYAYRFTETATGDTFVYSGDTGEAAGLSNFAAGADVLIHDCNWITPDTLLDRDEVPDRYMAPPFKAGYYEVLAERVRPDNQDTTASIHSTPTQAATTASEAGVSTLVLTHLNPYVDREAVRDEAMETFDGEVLVAEPGLTINDFE